MLTHFSVRYQFTLICITTVLLVLSSCGDSSDGNERQAPLAITTPTPLPTISPTPTPNATPAATDVQMRSTSSEQDFVDTMQRILQRQVSVATEALALEQANDVATSPLAPSAADTSENSTTYLLEAGVDELDKVKYTDNGVLFTAPSAFNQCCFDIIPLPIPVDTTLAVDSVPANNPASTHSITIFQTDEYANVTVTASIDLPSSQTVEGLFVSNERLIAVKTNQYFTFYGSSWNNAEAWENQQFAIDSYDISTLSAPQQRDTISIEGGFVESRMIDGELYILSRFVPVITQQSTTALADALENNDITFSALVPSITINGNRSNLFNATDCLLPEETFYPSTSSIITTITRIAVDNPGSYSSICSVDNATGLYMTNASIYLYRSIYDNNQVSSEQRYRSRIHRIAINDSALNYAGSVDIPGELWGSGQTDFRLNEYLHSNNQRYLRAFTSVFTDDANDRLDHLLTIYSVESNGFTLASQLPNQQQPEEIGRPNEDLYGVRFFAERAYAVTFERTDPFYVIDLSDPLAPAITGSLAVPGFSDFLHPVNNDLLLGLGRENRLTKLELFNITNPASPSSQGSILIGSDSSSNASTNTSIYSYSEAEYNRHAFNYSSRDNGLADRLSIPVEVNFRDSNNNFVSSNKLYLFEIRDKATPAIASLAMIGNLTADNAPNNFYPTYQRSRFNGDAIFYIADGLVWSSLWTDSANQQGPFSQ